MKHTALQVSGSRERTRTCTHAPSRPAHVKVLKGAADRLWPGGRVHLSHASSPHAASTWWRTYLGENKGDPPLPTALFLSPSLRRMSKEPVSPSRTPLLFSPCRGCALPFRGSTWAFLVSRVLFIRVQFTVCRVEVGIPSSGSLSIFYLPSCDLHDEPDGQLSSLTWKKHPEPHLSFFPEKDSDLLPSMNSQRDLSRSTGAVCLCPPVVRWNRSVLRQSSPASSAPETNFMEDSFSPDRGVAWGSGLFGSPLTTCSAGRFITGHGPVPVPGPCGGGVGTPVLRPGLSVSLPQ